MAKISVILAHPDPVSFNHAIAQTTLGQLHQNHHQVFFHDLYAEDFPPLLPKDEWLKDALLPPLVKLHCDEIAQAEGVVIIHPNWWGQPPAILKGWIDRVLRVGVAYRFLENDNGEGVPQGLLKARSAIVFNTSNTSESREQNTFGDPLQSIWKNCIFNLCGVHTFYRKMYRIVVTSTPDERASWLSDAKEVINQYFSPQFCTIPLPGIPAIGPSDYQIEKPQKKH